MNLKKISSSAIFYSRFKVANKLASNFANFIIKQKVYSTKWINNKCLSTKYFRISNPDLATD